MHLLPAEEQEQISEAAEEAGMETEQEIPSPAEAIALPPPPEDAGALLYRVGQMEAQLAQLQQTISSQTRVIVEQQEELAATEAQTEAQEVMLEEAIAAEEEEPEPSFWEKCIGGHCPKKRNPDE